MSGFHTAAVAVGDVIDMSRADILENEQRAQVRATLRSPSNSTAITLLAPIQYRNLKTARVTSINRIQQRTKKFPNGSKYVFTCVFVDLEDAEGAVPNRKAENSKMDVAVRDRYYKEPTEKWQRPQFVTGENNGSEEKK